MKERERESDMLEAQELISIPRANVKQQDDETALQMTYSCVL